MGSIGTKLFVLIGVIVIVFSSFLLYRTYEISDRHVNEDVATHAQMALQFDLSIRKYVADEIRPIMYGLVGEEEFIPESMSTSFVARAIFDDVRTHFPDYILKFSSDDPRNPANQAGPEELKFINYFNENPKEKGWSGKISIDGKQYYARFNARRMKESCLRCHGDPADAPKSLLQRYGSKAGFHRPVGEVIALDTIAIPISRVQERLWSEITNNFIITGIGLVLLFIALFFSVKFFVTNRLSSISKHFAEASSQAEYLHIKPIDEDGYKDEISTLAKSYNILALKLKEYYSSLDREIRERSRTNDLLQKEIEERKSAEEKLSQSKITLQNVLDSSSPICITSTDYQIIQANKAYYEIWPNKADTEERLKCFESRPGSLCHTDLCPLKRILEGEEEVTVDATKYQSNGTKLEFIITARPIRNADGELIGIVESFQDITARKQAEMAKAELIDDLQAALDKVNLLSGLLPICASCKKIRDDKGYWKQIEGYIREHSEAEFSHGICPDCAKELYPEMYEKIKDKVNIKKDS